MHTRYLFGLGLVVLGWSSLSQAATPSVADALKLTPIQTNVDYEKPSPDDVSKATIQPEKNDKVTAWVVRSAGGEMLRRFSDTNADNMVDQWSYFLGGREVYRDIDADFDGKADQYRWFQLAGTRWAIDANEDGQIDSWKAISPHELAEEAVRALATSNDRLFTTLLPSDNELTSLGLGKSAQARITEQVRSARTGFGKLAGGQKYVTGGARFLDFGAARPGTIPAGTDGATRDVTYYENVTVLVGTDGDKNEQVYLGEMLKIGDAWRLVALPQLGENAGPVGPFALANAAGPAASMGGGAAPTEQMTELMDRLQQIDQQSSTANAEQLNKLTSERADLLLKLYEISPSDRATWVNQLADMLSAAVPTQRYTEGIKRLDDLAARLAKDGADAGMIAHVEFRRIWAEYGQAQLDPKANVAKVQDNWLSSLEQFTKDYPNSDDADEAMLQLGMAQEFAGETDEAVRWYTQLSKRFTNTPEGQKASGALRRLDSIGNQLVLSGPGLAGGKVDLQSYKGKLVVVHYWASWCEPCKNDMKQLQVLYGKYREKGFEVVGINLDTSLDAAKQYVAAQKITWAQMADGEGLDGQLANNMGVMTLPLMLLVDDKGQVVSRNLNILEVETEIKRALRL